MSDECRRKKEASDLRCFLPPALLVELALVLAIAGSSARQVSAQTPPPDSRFGAVEAFRASKDAADLRLGWERVIFFWYQIQPNGPGEWNEFYYEDGWLADARANGREVVGLIEGTPGWATDGSPNAGVPRGLYLPVDDAGNLWATFVRTIIRRYAGRIDHWIVWNEPDIAPGEYGVQWEGSVADFVQLTKVAYRVAKQENPNAVIHFAGLTYWHDAVYGRELYLQRYIDEARKDPAAAADHFYFDAISLHIYFTTDTVYDITRIFADLLRRNGLTQEIWINETNAPPYDDPLNPWTIPDWKISLDQQAGFVVQAFAQGLAAGAQRIAVYKLVDFPPYPPGYEPYGLVRADGTRRPAFEAMRAIVTHFADTRSAIMDRTDARSIVTLDRGDRVTRVLWARGNYAVPLDLPARASWGLLVTHLGAAQVITPTSGLYRLTLPAAQCDTLHGCAVGGSPLILVERQVDVRPNLQAEQGATARPKTSPAHSATSTRLPTATPTLRPTLITAPASPTPDPARNSIRDSSLIEDLSSISGLIVLAIAALSMLVVWTTNRRRNGPSH